MIVYQIKKAIWIYDNDGHLKFDGYESVGTPFLNESDALECMPYQGKVESGIYPDYIIDEIDVLDKNPKTPVTYPL